MVPTQLLLPAPIIVALTLIAVASADTWPQDAHGGDSDASSDGAQPPESREPSATDSDMQLPLFEVCS